MSRDAGPRARVTRQRRGGVSITSTELSALVARALRRSGAPANGEAVLTLVDDATIAKLNATHMGKRGPTDVLSFPLIDPRDFPARASARISSVRQRGVAAQVPIGDIVISVDRAIEQAREGRGGVDGATKHSVADEVRLLAVHGALHLCGWDHATPASQAAMWREQTLILRAHTAAMKRSGR
ncbi:MAG: rRNA maturation RNase YbeY [Chloroflexi bacterium]|nr:rRNA maturation RNase YbeY [Chloroflexota bacterium]